MKSIRHILSFAGTLLLFIVIALASCKKDSVETVKMHTNYFGLIDGRYVTYEVMEIEHDINLDPKHDTLRYELKTVVGPEYIDNEGRSAREIHRFKRYSSTEAWTITDVWTSLIHNYMGELVEENVRIIKMVFPPKIEKNWNPNAFNSLDSTNYYYSNIHRPAVLSGLQFDSTITVEQELFTSFIDHRFKREIYAADIGLISKTYKDLTITNFDSLNVQKGNEIHYKCTGFGFE